MANANPQQNPNPQQQNQQDQRGNSRHDGGNPMGGDTNRAGQGDDLDREFQNRQGS